MVFAHQEVLVKRIEYNLLTRNSDDLAHKPNGKEEKFSVKVREKEAIQHNLSKMTIHRDICIISSLSIKFTQFIWFDVFLKKKRHVKFIKFYLKPQNL